MHLISIMDLILPSASEVSRRLSLVDNTLGVTDLWAEPLPAGEGQRKHEGWAPGEGLITCAVSGPVSTFCHYTQ